MVNIHEVHESEEASARAAAPETSKDLVISDIAEDDDEFEDDDGEEDIEGEDDGDDDEDLYADESIFERIAALKEIVPEAHRDRISVVASVVAGATKGLLRFGGKTAWVVTTSVLLLVLPLGMEVEKEQQLIAWENEQKAAVQQQRQMLQPALYGGPVANPLGQVAGSR
eukprot:Opistho-2@21590